MKVSLAALPALVALLCVPAAVALGAGAVADVAGAAGATLPSTPSPQVSLPAPDLALPEAQLPVEVGGVRVSAGAQAGAGASVGGSGADAGGSMAPLSSRATFADEAAAVATQAAGAGAMTVLLVSASSGLDGLRALLARPSARLQQAGRFVLRLLPLAPLLPLFSRIEGSKVLDNPVRAHVHQVVVQDPGLSLEEVRSRAGIAWGTAVHHLRRLEDNGLLVSVVQNARRRYFAANTPASSHRVQVAALAHPTARRLAEQVQQRPGLDQGSLCEALALRNPTASKHLQQLAQHGLVLVERDGRRCRYHPTAKLHTALGIVAGAATPPAIQAAPAAAPPTAIPA